MRHHAGLAVLLAMALVAAPATAQNGKGKGKGNGKPDRDQPAAAAQARGKDKVKTPPGQAKRAARKAQAREHVNRLPQGFDKLAKSERRVDRYVVGAAALAATHGLANDALALRLVDDRLEVRNRAGDVLFDMNEDRAQRMGIWNLNVVPGESRENAPAFCRSGAGHPVWGREWCLRKGFGLGSDSDRVWSRGTVEDIIFGRRVEQDRLDRGSLLDVLGDVIFGRLALHSLALGFDQPLAGYWVAEPNAPRLLRINAGDEPVAELIDLNGDDRVDVLYVTHDGN